MGLADWGAPPTHLFWSSDAYSQVQVGDQSGKTVILSLEVCSSGFLFVSCSLGKPHSTSFRLPRRPFSSATKVNQKSPSSHICDPIKLQKRAVLGIHRKKLHLPDVPGPTASYTDRQKSRFSHLWTPCFARYRATRGSESGD